jgi:uncharacterized protein YndB with AHSA1/START domain
MLALAGFAPAEVLDSAANGFTVKTTVTIKAAPDEVYRHVLHIGDWWSPDHTFSHDPHNLRIEDHPGGCFCEKLPDNGFVRFMEVINLAPGKTIVLSGALGPMQTLAATGAMQIRFSPVEGGTKLDMTYAVMGYLPQGMNTFAPIVDMVLAQQFTRLKSLIETGQPASK